MSAIERIEKYLGVNTLTLFGINLTLELDESLMCTRWLEEAIQLENNLTKEMDNETFFKQKFFMYIIKALIGKCKSEDVLMEESLLKQTTNDTVNLTFLIQQEEKPPPQQSDNPWQRPKKTFKNKQTKTQPAKEKKVHESKRDDLPKIQKKPKSAPTDHEEKKILSFKMGQK